jgi:hypothetical protein
MRYAMPYTGILLEWTHQNKAKKAYFRERMLYGS